MIGSTRTLHPHPSVFFFTDFALIVRLLQQESRAYSMKETLSFLVELLWMSSALLLQGMLCEFPFSCWTHIMRVPGQVFEETTFLIAQYTRFLCSCNSVKLMRVFVSRAFLMHRRFALKQNFPQTYVQVVSLADCDRCFVAVSSWITLEITLAGERTILIACTEFVCFG
jgi:hypothetical protein